MRGNIYYYGQREIGESVFKWASFADEGTVVGLNCQDIMPFCRNYGTILPIYQIYILICQFAADL